jgi:hypothetical protein
MENWWKDADRGRPKHWEKNQSQCYYVHHKLHMDWPGIEPRSLYLQATN